VELFLSGVILTVLLAIPVAALLFRRMTRRLRSRLARSRDTDEELTKLTG